MKKLSLIICFLVVIMCGVSLISCYNLDSNDTESSGVIDNDIEKSKSNEDLVGLAPLPEPNYKVDEWDTDASEYYVAIDNKFYVNEWVDSKWAEEPYQNVKVFIKALEWLDISPAYDGEYRDLYRAYRIDLGAAKRSAGVYNEEPTALNKQKYNIFKRQVAIQVDKLNEYIATAKQRKLAELLEHFESIGVVGEIVEDRILVTINKEQMLSLNDTRFILFIVSEDDSDYISVPE